MIEEIFTLKNLIYTFKAFLALTIALYVSMSMGLDKPMWAMITVLFLQRRPETGFIVEKGFLKIAASAIGIIVGFIIIDLFLPYPALSIFSLCIFISITMYFSVGMSHPNFIYALALANTTCTIVVFFSVANPSLTTSESVFYIGYSRLTEVTIGSLCSFFVNYFIFPIKIKDKLKEDSSKVLDLTINYIKHVFNIDDFSNNSKHNKEVEDILDNLINLDNELSASKYENLNNKVYNDFSISIIKLIQAAHFLRKWTVRNKQNKVFKEKLDRIAQNLTNLNSDTYTSDFESKDKSISEVIKRFRTVIKNYDLINKNEPSERNHKEYLTFKNYNNPILIFLTVSKTIFLLIILALFWMNTQSNSTLLTMLIIPCLLSQLFIPELRATKLIGQAITGMIISIPISIFFTLNLLAQVEGYFELLMLVLIVTLFLPMMTMTNPRFQAYSLGFCLGVISLVQPSNHMNFNISGTLTIGLSAIFGCIVLWLTFKLYPHRPYAITRKYTIKSIINDHKKLRRKELSKEQYQATLIKKILCIYKNRKDDYSSERDIEFALESLAKSI
ncbi:FUSC family protein [Francisella sp. LA112445]|uniref:FUSC family protein n=1 Tax=Francisella sp. LA112445 TaxID=1395624 RepID=UPI001788C57C|nr:FUSC family protein [Francisella sp. LA112445]QIW10018.1 FUSC family protein [Francisella sp. LA112445]